MPQKLQREKKSAHSRYTIDPLISQNSILHLVLNTLLAPVVFVVSPVPMPSPTTPHQPNHDKRKLSDLERRAIYETLLGRSNNGRIAHGEYTTTAATFQCHWKTVARIWKRGQESLRNGSVVAVVNARFKGNSGPKVQRSPSDIRAAVKAVPLVARQILRSVVEHSGIPKTTLVRHMAEEDQLKSKSSYSKPFLTEDNERSRVKHAMSFLFQSSKKITFSNMHNFVHVDEKWFFLTTVKKRYYAYEDEVLPSRYLKSKRFITKVMFLAAVARPRYDFHKKSMFDGKLGVWPFIEKVPAKRGSKNRPKGTIVTVPQTVTADVYRDMILKNVVPAIKSKFPLGDQSKIIYLQQDNASPHNCVTSQLLLQYGVEGIEAANQPANSPDLNILDLGYFNSIQSLQSQKVTRTIEELVDAVNSSFHELPVDTLSKTFITLQKVMEKTLENMGKNDYKLPHMRKDASIKDLSLFNVNCDPAIHRPQLRLTVNQ
ncbi:hypothetical protein AaE_014485 [Aphanomyces astaci]|uniref:DUF7769 domain-containing protein n=1 Tax=Aphanomyces astaci TaxID=112090 RepID=A0A6A4Z6L6_APHAT|nr:hypothetical protein AaE_014485 [Aphanomyces astaci]